MKFIFFLSENINSEINRLIFYNNYKYINDFLSSY